jgi:lysophospholipase L1-like esterase
MKKHPLLRSYSMMHQALLYLNYTMSNSKIAIIAATIVIIGGVILFIALRCHNAAHRNVPATSNSAAAGSIRYLPLGDSYTIGQSVSTKQRWPNQLVATLDTQGSKLQIVANPSVTGYTSQDLINQELPLVASMKPQFVTILIGVNDYVQGVPIETFHTNLEYILSVLSKELPHPHAILFVTIPDFGKTPTGAEYGSPAASMAGVEKFNSVIKEVASQHQLPVADIFGVSQAVATDPSLIAFDGLHPSGKEYAAWTKIIDATIMQSGILKPLQKSTTIQHENEPVRAS